ncbi:MAG: penicillin-binding protein 1A [Neisseriaceae bacterium]|nr:penicillin-binding protein 1A [Neisseriaceae bacterium]
MLKKIVITCLTLVFVLFLIGIGVLSFAIIKVYPNLPNLDRITHYQPRMPLKIYSSDGVLIGVYGEERRAFTPIDQFPQVLKYAVIAAEDKRFYEHWGVDVIGVARAIIGNLRSGGIQSGASTITQQVARNFLLNNERSYERKFKEALLAYKIERSLTKDQILELYFNQIYLGQRAYGFAAASSAYYNKPVQDLTLAEAAMLAGLPKAPSAYNPIVNPDRAKLRQTYILNNMQALGMISQEQRNQAHQEELVYQTGQLGIDDNALYVAEMTRQLMFEKYGESAYTQGFHVYTTVSIENQRAATQALRNTLSNFDKGRAYRGAENFLDLSQFPDEQKEEKAAQLLALFHTVDRMVPAVVLNADKNRVTLNIKGVAKPVVMEGKSLQFVRNTINNKKFAKRQLQVGSVVRVVKNKDTWSFAQMPELEGALVSIDAQNGAIRALVGGYDFYQKEFNRATQALRQPGSSFKPYVYSAALDKGITASTMVNDAPISLPGLGPHGKDWNPKNSDGRYAGMMTVHSALVASKNVVSIRILMAIGTDYAYRYVQKFGIPAKYQAPNLSMVLGAGVVTPLEMARGYAVFANGGYRVTPYIIDKIYDSQGRLVAKTQPQTVGNVQNPAPRAIDQRNAFIMYQIMKDITRVGTAARASSLKRSDIAGKTGTTNDQKDAWFVGYTPKISTAVFIGYDKPRSMGKVGMGGTIALPVWIQYMRHALKGIPVSNTPMPAGVVRANGEYYLKEWQHTNPALALDNRSDETDEEMEGEILEPVATGEAGTAETHSGGDVGTPLQPTNIENLF